MLTSTAVSILLHRDSGLLAVVSDDMVIRIIDIETRRIVRELTGFHGRVLDIVSNETKEGYSGAQILVFERRPFRLIRDGLLPRVWIQ